MVAKNWDGAAFKALITKKLDDAVDRKLKDIAAIAREAANTQAQLFFIELVALVNSHINAPPEELMPYGAVWEDLLEPYREKKMKFFGSQAFFDASGRLVENIENITNKVAQVFGNPTSRQAVSVTQARDGTFSILIDPFPRLKEDTDKGVTRLVADAMTGDIDYWKLINSYGVIRPLILPLIKFYAHVEIPKAIDDALEAQGYKVTHG